MPLVPDNASKAAVLSMVDALIGVPNLPEEALAEIQEKKAEYEKAMEAFKAAGGEVGKKRKEKRDAKADKAAPTLPINGFGCSKYRYADKDCG